MTLRHRAAYLDDAVDRVQETVTDAVEKLKASKLEFDTIVVTGISGLLIGPIVAYLMQKNLLVIRKSDDSSTHSSMPAEGVIGKKWLFLDDFISSGQTLTKVKEKVSQLSYGAHHETEFVGCYLYAHAYRKVYGPEYWGS